MIFQMLWFFLVPVILRTTALATTTTTLPVLVSVVIMVAGLSDGPAGAQVEASLSEASFSARPIKRRISKPEGSSSAAATEEGNATKASDGDEQNDGNTQTKVHYDSEDDGGFPTIVTKGYRFFNSHTGEEFVVRGIDYFPRPNVGDLNHNSMDFYTDEYSHMWKRDIPYLQELGVNAIRLYAVDPTLNHDAFMCALQDAGIYVIVALAHDCPTCAVTRDEAPDCYPPELKLQGQQVIQVFSQYRNTLAFSAGNEVNHFTPVGAGGQWNAPCQKKFIQDMRKYMANCLEHDDELRHIPIGLVSADNERGALAKYYNCQDDPDDPYQRAEWYGLNTYVFCDGKAQSFEEALGFQLLADSFASYNYSIPVLLTEFGCLSETFPTVDGYEGTRNFYQAKWLATQMSIREQFAGGFAFEYSMEMENAGIPFPFKQFGHQNYGIGYFGPERCDEIDTPCSYHPMPSFDALKKAYHVDIANQTTLDDFEPEPSRQPASECPPDYPALNTYDWSKVEGTTSLECPNLSFKSRETSTVKNGIRGFFDRREKKSENRKFDICQAIKAQPTPKSNAKTTTSNSTMTNNAQNATAQSEQTGFKPPTKKITRSFFYVGIVAITAIVLSAVWRHRNDALTLVCVKPTKSCNKTNTTSPSNLTTSMSYNSSSDSVNDGDHNETTQLLPMTNRKSRKGNGSYNSVKG